MDVFTNFWSVVYIFSSKKTTYHFGGAHDDRLLLAIHVSCQKYVRTLPPISKRFCIVRVILHTSLILYTSLRYELIDVPTNFCCLVHQFLPWRPARRRHSDHIHAAMHAIRLKHLSGILLPSVLPLCKYYLHVLSLSDLCILQCTPVLIL